MENFERDFFVKFFTFLMYLSWVIYKNSKIPEQRVRALEVLSLTIYTTKINHSFINKIR